MNLPTIRDLIIVIGLSTASMIFPMVPPLNEFPLNLVPLILIFIILPGYSLVAVINPLLNNAPFYKKIFYSIGTSILITAIIYFISINTQINISIYNILIFLTIIMSILAIVRRFFINKNLKSHIGKKALKVDSEKESTSKKLDKSSKVSFQESKFVKTAVEPYHVEKKADENIEDSKYPNLDIILILIFTFLGVIFILTPTLNKTDVRTILGLLMVLLIPGYALIASLFPRKDDLEIIERLTLSFGLSIAITPIIGLLLNYTPFGIRLDPILISLSIITVILCIVTFFRRKRVPKEFRFFIDINTIFKRLVEGFNRNSKTEKILSIILICSIILAISTTAYVLTKPKSSEAFTEFYILGSNGKASNYPTNLTSGEHGQVIVGIINHENVKTSYHLIITLNGTVLDDRILTLNNGEKLEIPFVFTAGNTGENKMEFILYKIPDNNKIYRSLHLWINITDGA